jgi:hypothetical protein
VRGRGPRTVKSCWAIVLRAPRVRPHIAPGLILPSVGNPGLHLIAQRGVAGMFTELERTARLELNAQGATAAMEAAR